MPTTAEQADWFAESFAKLVANVEQAILGKNHVVRLAFTSLLSGGHLLLEDVPGTGKTMLAKAMANTVQGTNSRIQFTPDLLPSDVVGGTVYDQRAGTFELRKGPVFATIVLADEINRASPKTQSALLEVMEEGQVTIDGTTHPVGPPFMVIATQNPIEQAGTYRLPEAQLDRFLMRTSLGYPDEESTVQLLAESATTNRSTTVTPLITTQAVVDMAALAAEVHVDRSILLYISRLAEATRREPEVRLGVSVRGCMAFTRVAKTWAASLGRHYVLPDDVKELALPVLSHRMVLEPEAEFAGATVTNVLSRVLSQVEPPTERVA
ncbi:MAG: AAA family ATPase [Microthrixaceae bacterium]|jgi:MoxR-like ATPase